MQIHANGLMNLVVTHSEEFHRHSFPIDIDFEEGVVIFAATSTGAVVVYVVTEENVSLSDFEFLTLGGVFLGVKNDSKNFGNKKI